MTVRPQDDCEGCGFQIGENALGQVNDHVVCWDGIKRKPVTFHKRCNPSEPDLQRHHKIGLAPAKLGATIQSIPIGNEPEFPTISYRISNRGGA